MTTKFTPYQLRELSRSFEGFSTPDWYPKVYAALNQAADDAEDAERWREFNRSGWPVCFLGVTYETSEALNAAIDATRKESSHD